MTSATDRNLRAILLLAPLAIGGLALGLHGPMAQAAGYNRFADQSVVAGIPHAGDVLSNIVFLAAGTSGLILLCSARSKLAFQYPRERLPYAVFFVGVLLTAFGSAYYHLAPDIDRLFWDRLPMTVSFVALLAAVLSDRVSPALAAKLLWPLLLLGAASVLVWRVTEQAGRGDLRLYAFVQYGAVAAIVLMLLLYPARHTHTGLLWAAAGGYALAKACELLDEPILRATGSVSGHTLKHVVAGLATGCVVWMLARRRPSTYEARTLSVPL